VNTDATLTAYVRFDALGIGPEAAPPTAAGIRSYLGRSLPAYMVPSAVVVVERFPLTPNGKVDLAALPDPETHASRVTYVPPNTPIERQLTELWEDVLKVDRISVEDDFFALGGHSLKLTQLVARIRDRFGVSFDLRVAYESPSVAAMSRAIGNLLIADVGEDELAELLDEVDAIDATDATDATDAIDAIGSPNESTLP
jgi:acyl carrier protein